MTPTKTPPSTDTRALPSDEEILARFHRLRITIGLSRTKFGYLTTGTPGIIKQMEAGRHLQSKSRERMAHVLDEIEREHSIPADTENVNGKRTKLDEENNPAVGKESLASAMEE